MLVVGGGGQRRVEDLARYKLLETFRLVANHKPWITPTCPNREVSLRNSSKQPTHFTLSFFHVSQHFAQPFPLTWLRFIARIYLRFSRDSLVCTFCKRSLSPRRGETYVSEGLSPFQQRLVNCTLCPLIDGVTYHGRET